MALYEPELHREKLCLGWDEVAEDYQTITAPFLAQYLPKLLELADLKPDMLVLDVGTGTGLAAIQASERIKPEGRVLATDFSEQMLNVARSLVEEQNITNIDVYKMTAEELDIESKSFDRVICNFGLSFFQEPEKALAEMYRVLKENGRLTLTTWAKEDKCLVLGLMDHILKDCVPELKKTYAPSIFKFGTKKALKTALEDAGFRDVDIITEMHTARYDKAEDYWLKLYQTNPELRNTISVLTAEEVQKVKDKVCKEAEKYRVGERIILPSEALIATGLK
jgi:ubiquinone/menaquinone biosynthesis C-methylase UbiE